MVAHKRNATMYFSLLNTPWVCLTSCIPAQSRTKMQHPPWKVAHETFYTTSGPSTPIWKSIVPSFAFSSDWECQQWAEICIRITRPEFTKCFFLTFPFIESSQHETLLSPFLEGSVREVSNEPIIRPVAERLSDINSERGRLSSFITSQNASCRSWMWRSPMWRLKKKHWVGQ